MIMSTSAGDLEIRMKLDQLTKDVDSEGSATIENKISDIKTLFNGGETAPDARAAKPEPWTSRVNNQGFPLKSQVAPKSVLMLQLLNAAFFSAFLPESQVKVGSTYPVEWTDATDKTAVKGKTQLAEIVNGVARLVSDFDISRPSIERPMKLKLTSWVEVSSGKTVKTEGLSENPPGPNGVGLKSLTFKVEREGK